MTKTIPPGWLRNSVFFLGKKSESGVPNRNLLVCPTAMICCAVVLSGCSDGTSLSNSELNEVQSDQLEQAAKTVSLEQAEKNIAELIEHANELESDFKFTEAVGVWESIYQLVNEQAGEESWQATNARLSLETAPKQAAFNDAQLNVLQTFVQRQSVATEHLKQKRYQQAANEMKSMIGDTESLLGGNSHSVGRLHLSLGQLYYQLGKFQESNQYLQSALEINREQLGMIHPETDTNMFMLGQTFMQTGDRANGLVALEQAATISSQLWGSEHLTTAARLNDLGVAYHASGKANESLSKLQEALTLRRELLKPEDSLIGETLRNLGVVYLDMQQLGPASDALLEAVDILSNAAGESNVMTLDTRTRLATVKMLSQEYLAAEGQLRQVVHQFETHADNSTELAKACFQLAVALGYQGQYHEAEPLLNRALNIQRNSLGQWHPETVQTLRTLAALYQRTGKDEQAQSINASLRRLNPQAGNQVNENQPATQESNIPDSSNQN